MNASVTLYMKSKDTKGAFLGQYSFDCYITKMLANQADPGGRVDKIYLKIVDGTEDLGLPE